MNSCVSSPEDGPVGPKHVEIRRYMNKIEIVTSVGFSFHILNSSVDKDPSLKILHLFNRPLVASILEAACPF